jgi:hypothetical protein
MAVAFKTPLANMFPEKLNPSEQPYTAPKDNRSLPKVVRMPVEADYDELAIPSNKLAWNLPSKADLYNNSLTMIDHKKITPPANKIGYKELPNLSLPDLTQTNVSGFSCLVGTTAAQRDEKLIENVSKVPIRWNTSI